MSDKRRMMDIMAICTKAIDEAEEAGRNGSKAAIIVNCKGMKPAGKVHRLFPECPRGKVVKRLQIRGVRFFSVQYNAEELRDALTARVGQISGMRAHLRKEAEKETNQ